MKKFLKIMLSFTIMLSLCSADMHAANNIDTLKETTEQSSTIKNLENYIKSGSGTANDPYVLDDNCPYKPLMDSIVNKQILESQNSTSTSKKTISLGAKKISLGVSLLASETTYMSSTIAETNQTKGGFWVCNNYNSAKMVLSDGNCWIKKIAYITKAEVIDGYRTILYNQSNSIKSAVLTHVSTGISFLSLVQTLLKVTACGTAVAYAGAALAVYSSASYINASKDPYKNAFIWQNKGCGLLRIVYYYSYHGAWYATTTSCNWTKYPTAYEPNACFGTGNYTSNLEKLSSIK